MYINPNIAFLIGDFILIALIIRFIRQYRKAEREDEVC